MSRDAGRLSGSRGSLMLMMAEIFSKNLVGTSRIISAVPCGDSGNFNGLFCCSVEAATSCCNATFGNVFGRPFAPTTLAVNDANATSTAIAFTTMTVTATAPASHSNNADENIKVGVGVGVPLGLLLLLSLVFASWTERRRRRGMEKADRETGWSDGHLGFEKAQKYRMNGVRYEADGGERRTPELSDGGEVHEVGGAS